MGRFAHVEARRKAITNETDAPFLYSSIAIARIPWKADIRKPSTTE